MESSSVVARKPLEGARAPGSAGHADIALFFVVRADSTTPERRSDASRPVRLPPTRTPPRATSHEPRRASRDAPPAVAREPLDVADPALPAAQSVERVLERKCKPRPLQTPFRPRPCATGPRRRAPAAAQPSRRAPRTTLSTPPRPLGRARDAGRVSPTRRTASTTRSSRDGGPRRTAAAWRRRMPRRSRARTKTPRRRSAPGRRPLTPRGRARRRRRASPSTRTGGVSRCWSRRRGGDAKPESKRISG